MSFFGRTSLTETFSIPTNEKSGAWGQEAWASCLPSDMNEIKNTVFPDAFIVDYVKVYKKKG